MAQDNEFTVWHAFGNQYWPAKYLIDADGQVRYVHFGEGDYEETEAAIRDLLAEAGDAAMPAGARRSPGRRADARGDDAGDVSGARRAREAGRRTRWCPAGATSGRCRAISRRTGSRTAGAWRIDARVGDRARARPGSACASARGACSWCSARDIARPARVRVRLDGRPIPDRLAGDDVRDGVVRVRSQRLYRLVDLPRAGSHG